LLCGVCKLEADDSPYVSDDNEMNTSGSASSRPLVIQCPVTDESAGLTVNKSTSADTCDNITVMLAAQSNRQCAQTTSPLPG